MSHVADGDLHAYLDGALDLYPAEEARRIRSHLESCSECRRRLADEEGVRKSASSILAGTDPGSVDVPPFEAIRRRASAGASVPRESGGRGALVLRFGWAASVLVALGVGWMVGRQPDVRSGGGTVPPASLADAAGAERAPEAGEGALTPRAEVASAEAEAAMRDQVAASDPGDVEPEPVVIGPTAWSDTPGVAVHAARPATEPAEQARLRDTIQVATAAPDSVPPGIRTLPGAAAEEDAALPPDAGRITGRVVAGGTDAPLVGAQVVVEGTSVGAQTDEEGRYVLAPVPAGSQALRFNYIGYETVAETLTVRPGATAVVDFAPSTRALQLQALRVTGVADPVEGVRMPSDVDRVGTAEAPAGAVRPLLVPGLEVLQVGWTEVAPGVEGLLVVQRLAGDTTRLELRFGGLDGAAREPPPGLLDEPLPEGVSQVVGRLPDGGGWVVLRGRLPADRLRELLSRVGG